MGAEESSLLGRFVTREWGGVWVQEQWQRDSVVKASNDTISDTCLYAGQDLLLEVWIDAYS